MLLRRGPGLRSAASPSGNVLRHAPRGGRATGQAGVPLPARTSGVQAATECCLLGAAQDLSLEAVEQDVAAFKSTNGLHARAEVPLYCVTIRELGRRGRGQLADQLARRVVAELPRNGSAEEDAQRLYSALLEGRCLRGETDDAARLYLEMVERRNLLPSHRALHMLMELLSFPPPDKSGQKQQQTEAAPDEDDVDTNKPKDAVATDEKRAKTKAKEKTKVKEIAKAKTGDDVAARQEERKKGVSLKVAEIFEEMKARGHLTTAAYNMLLPVVGRKERKLSSLKNLLDEMIAHDVPRNQLTWKALLESARGPEEFEQIKKVMSANGWKPERSADAVLRVLPKYASSAELLSFLEENVHRVHAPTFNSLILSYARAGNFEAAYASAVKMRKARFLPSKKAFLSFLKCGGYVLEERDIEWMWRDLTGKLAQSGRKINRDYYHAKMIAYLRRKNPEAVRRTLAEMEESGVEPNSYTYYLLILVDDVDGFF